MTQTYDGTPQANRVVLADANALARHAAEFLLAEADRTTGRFTLSLSGGATPKLLFEVLAGAEFRDRMPWERTHLFWGDERFVAPDDSDSNYRMAREALLDHVPVPPANVHPMPTDGTPEDAAARYDGLLRTYYGRESLDPARPLFDVTLLGLGEDGHTASLFPGTPALAESLAWVVPVTEGVPQPRLTLTYPALASSGTVAFLVSGESKRAVLGRIWAGDRTQPATLVHAVGQTRWFVDAAAAG